MHSFDWNDLRYFLAIHREGTLAGAARNLRVQHSTVGRRLEMLEAALGASLFARTPGRLPAHRGRDRGSLARRGCRAGAGGDRAPGGRARQRIEGVVRLTASEAFSGFLVRRLAELQTRHPGLMVEILSGNRSFDLSRGEADLALRITNTTQPELICKRIGDAGWSLYAAEGYLARRGVPPVPDLAGHDVIGFDESMAQVPGALWLKEHAFGPT